MGRCSACGEALPENAVTCPACGEPARVFLGATGNPVETELLEARLDSAGLPYMKQAHRGGGLLQLLNGFFAPGADFYVPADRLAEARRALDMEVDGRDASPRAAGTAAQKPGGWKTRLLGLLIVCVLLALYFGLDALLTVIRSLFGA